MDKQDFVPGTEIIKPEVKLVGEDENAHFILAKVRRELKRAKVPNDVIGKFLEEARNGDYNNLLCVVQKYVNAV